MNLNFWAIRGFVIWIWHILFPLHWTSFVAVFNFLIVIYLSGKVPLGYDSFNVEYLKSIADVIQNPLLFWAQVLNVMNYESIYMMTWMYVAFVNKCSCTGLMVDPSMNISNLWLGNDYYLPKRDREWNFDLGQRGLIFCRMVQCEWIIFYLRWIADASHTYTNPYTKFICDTIFSALFTI